MAETAHRSLVPNDGAGSRAGSAGRSDRPTGAGLEPAGPRQSAPPGVAYGGVVSQRACRLPPTTQNKPLQQSQLPTDGLQAAPSRPQQRSPPKHPAPRDRQVVRRLSAPQHALRRRQRSCNVVHWSAASLTVVPAPKRASTAATAPPVAVLIARRREVPAPNALAISSKRRASITVSSRASRSLNPGKSPVVAVLSRGCSAGSSPRAERLPPTGAGPDSGMTRRRECRSGHGSRLTCLGYRWTPPDRSSGNPGS